VPVAGAAVVSMSSWIERTAAGRNAPV